MIRQMVGRAWCPENILHIHKDDAENTSDVVVTRWVVQDAGIYASGHGITWMKGTIPCRNSAGNSICAQQKDVGHNEKQKRVINGVNNDTDPDNHERGCERV